VGGVPELSADRLLLLRQVADLVPIATGIHCVRVGIDGVDGAGKTVFADELAAELQARGRQVIRISVDDFHNVRSIRYRRGRDSPMGCWLDSFNYTRLHADVLGPLGPGGNRRYRSACHDLVSDAELDPPALEAAPGSVLVLDGIFLHRDELIAIWDFSVFLEVSADIAASRLAQRDGTPGDPDHPSMTRYVEAQRLYEAACRPRQRASVVIDNSR
jgi:uridine kinase